MSMLDNGRTHSAAPLSARRGAAARPAAQQGHGFYRAGTRRSRPAWPVAGTRFRWKSRENAEQPAPPANRSGQVRLSTHCTTGTRLRFSAWYATTSKRFSQSFIPRRWDSLAKGSGTSSSDRAGSLLALMIGAHRQVAQQLAAPGETHRGDRWRAHIGTRRFRGQRYGHPRWQAVALHGLRRRAPETLPAGDARCRNEQ